MAVILPEILRSEMPGMEGFQGDAGWLIVLVPVIVIGFLFVLVPIPFILFYQAESVRRTCVERDPVSRWTDACPVPVLAAAVWLWVGAAMFALMPFSQNGVFPLFGTIISGAPGSVICLIAAAVWLWAGFGFYRLNRRAWWITVAVFLLMMTSALITFNRVDVMEMYREMGYSQVQLDQIEQFSFINSKTMLWWSLTGVVPLMGYLIFVKRYFRSSDRVSLPPD